MKENAGDSCGVLLRNAVSPDQSGSMVDQYYAEKQKPLWFSQKNDLEESNPEYEEVTGVFYSFIFFYKYVHKWYIKSTSK